MSRPRVILHIDLDCFYAQVESIRLGIPQDEPLAVQQWGSLLAVNYAARKFNIKRSENISEAKQKCPSIHLPHVETIGQTNTTQHDRRVEKAILKRYRDASASIFAIFARHCPVLQKASIDEVYLDVSDLVYERLEQSQGSKYVHESPGTIVIGSDQEQNEASDEMDQALHMGATIAFEIRSQVYDQLGYTCSAGIAHNKLLAKMASPLNKPNGQVIVPHRAVHFLMQTTDICSINGFGGKLGKRILELGVQTATDVQRFSMQELATRLGSEQTAEYVFWRCRGVDHDPVAEQSLSKSIMSAKQFREKCQFVKVKNWIQVLTSEVMERINDDQEVNHRVATKLSISFSSAIESKSKTIHLSQNQEVENVIEQFYDIIQVHEKDMFPLTQLAIVARGFRPLEEIQSTKPITKFFAPRSEGYTESEPDVKIQESFVTCPRCWKRIAKQDTQEHQDFHFALEIQKELRKAPSPVKKKAKKTIESYFLASPRPR